MNESKRPYRRSGPSFSASDLLPKPAGCSLCPNSARGHGFLADKPVVNPKIALMLDAPGAEDLLWGEGLSGGLGHHFIKHNLEPLGLQRSDVLITHVLRCKQPGVGKDAYPQANIRTNAENCCRVHDDVLKAWGPDLFLFTYDLWTILKTQPLVRVVKRDVAKAVKFAERGYKPLILMGERAGSLIFPYGWRPGCGSTKAWRGHYFEGTWPFGS